ncbi:hypothetical protein UlMin_020110 [Ulmus minor]
MGITVVTSSQVSHIKSSLKDLVLLYSPTKLVLLGSFPLMNQNLYLVLQQPALIPFHSACPLLIMKLFVWLDFSGSTNISLNITSGEKMKMEEERIEAENLRVKEVAQQLALIFDTVGAFKVKRKGGKGKLIFGSVTDQDLVDIIKAQLQRDVDKRIVSLPDIREIGEYVAELKLYPNVTARVRVIVYAN